MKSKKWICGLLVAFLFLSSGMALAQGRGHGRGHDKGEGEGEGEGRGKGRGKDKKEFRYSRQNRREFQSWYLGHQSNLPPGLAKKDRLPPGLERQLRVRGTLPPGLEDRVHPLPEEWVRVLPPPPPDCEHVAIGGRIVLLNRRTSVIVDIFKLF